MSDRTLGELITVRSPRGFDMEGIVFSHESNWITVVHVHGSFGNFYQNGFIRRMAQEYLAAGINLLSLNMTSHDGLAEGYRNSDFEYIGGAVADFEECLSDIEGAVQYARQFGDLIILQGHSLGCDRVLHFLINRKASYDFILLSPCDSYKLQAEWIAPETVEAQISRLKAKPSEPGLDWLPSEEYGVRGGGDWTYPIPITRKAFLSIAEGPPYRLINIQHPTKFRLDQRALIYIGGQDALQVWPHSVMFPYLQERIPLAEEAFEVNGDHMLSGCESLVIRKITDWIGNGATVERELTEVDRNRNKNCHLNPAEHIETHR